MNNMTDFTNQIGIYLSSAYNALQNHGVILPEKKNVKNLAPLINTVIAGEGLKRYQTIESAAAAEFQGEPDLRLVYDDNKNFYGLYRYTLNNGFAIANTQFNVKPELLWDKTLYTNIGVIQGTLNTDVPTITEQLSTLLYVGHNFSQGLGIELVDASYLFANSTYSRLPKELRTYNTSNMAYMFYNCYNLTTFPILYYNNIQNMENMFLNCLNLDRTSVNSVIATLPNFTQLINANSNNLQTYLGFAYDIANYGVSRLALRSAYNNGWDVPMDWATIIINYNTVEDSLIQTTSLEEPEDGFDIYMISNFLTNIDKTKVLTMDISGITKMQGANEYGNIGIFNNCINLTDITFDGTSNIRYMNNFFKNCSNLINISGFSSESAIGVSSLFQNCKTLKSLPNLFLNNVDYACGMFENCYNITEVPELNLGRVSNFTNMFSSCYNLTIAPQINTENAKRFDYMFKACTNLQTVYNYNTANITSMRGMFSQCNNLINIPDFNTEKVIDMSWIFSECNNLITLPQFNTTKVQNVSGMFSQTNITDIPLTYDFSNVLNTSNMFSYAAIINVPYIHTNNVSDASSMFYQANNIMNFAQSDFNFSKTINLSFTFGEVVNINTFPNITTTHMLKDTSSMFLNCYNLNEAMAFETTSVYNASKMFYNCTNLITVPLYNLSAATNIENMFYNCSNLTDTSYLNIIEGLPLAAQLTNQYANNIGLNIDRMTVTHMVLLQQKGYLGLEIPPYDIYYSTISDTQNYISETIERGI